MTAGRYPRAWPLSRWTRPRERRIALQMPCPGGDTFSTCSELETSCGWIDFLFLSRTCLLYEGLSIPFDFFPPGKRDSRMYSPSYLRVTMVGQADSWRIKRKRPSPMEVTESQPLSWLLGVSLTILHPIWIWNRMTLGLISRCSVSASYECRAN